MTVWIVLEHTYDSERIVSCHSSADTAKAVKAQKETVASDIYWYKIEEHEVVR